MNKAPSTALVVIDVQNDYFPAGQFPLWQADDTLARIETLVGHARWRGMPVVLVQHVADRQAGTAPFFNEGSTGVEIHPRLLAVAAGADIVVKRHADSFLGTTLASVLEQSAVRSLWLCGMMTQNCVTHTALSRSAEHYAVTVVGDACTTVSPILHGIALNALSDRVAVIATSALLG